MYSFGSCSDFGTSNKFAVSSVDGILQVYNSKTGDATPFTPPSHLTATFSCAKFKCSSLCTNLVQKGHGKAAADLNCSVLSLGTVTGDIHMYDSSKNELFAKLVGHKSKVNDICWHSEEKKADTTLFSCSNDQCIIEWDLTNKENMMKCKWEADKKEVMALKMGPHGRTLISAGTSIKLWDLKTRSLLIKYMAHTSPIIAVSFLNITKTNAKSSVADAIESVYGSFFVSAAIDERVAYVWKVKRSSEVHPKKPVRSLLLSDKPCSIDVKAARGDQTSAQVLFANQNGDVNYFDIQLDDKKKYMKATRVIRICDEAATPIGIVSAKFVSATSSCIQLVYGSSTRYAFDTVDVDSEDNINEEQIVLIREDPVKNQLLQETDNFKIQVPQKSVKTMYVSAQQFTHTPKRARTLSESNKLITMAEKLAAISAAQEKQGKNEAKSDSQAVLLAQGLKSNDQEVLNQVLQLSGKVLDKTVKQLHMLASMPLLKELSKRVPNSYPDRAITIGRWIEKVLFYHITFLQTHPDFDRVMTELRQRLHNRTRNYTAQRHLLIRMTELIESDRPVRHIKTAEEDHEEDVPIYIIDDDSADELSDEICDDSMEEDSIDDASVSQSDDDDDDEEEEEEEENVESEGNEEAMET